MQKWPRRDALDAATFHHQLGHCKLFTATAQNYRWLFDTQRQTLGGVSLCVCLCVFKVYPPSEQSNIRLDGATVNMIASSIWHSPVYIPSKVCCHCHGTIVCVRVNQS